MPIRPIDIVKSQDASQYKHSQNQRAQNEQAQISKSFQNMVQDEASKPVQANKSENKEFRYDAKEESRNAYGGSAGKGKEDKNNKKKHGGPDNKSDRPGGIDILI